VTGRGKAVQAAGVIWSAWTGGVLLDGLPSDVRPRDADEGFEVQQALEILAGPRLGWKIAATSAAGQAHIGVTGPLPGRLFSRFAFGEGSVLASDHLHMAVVEAEFAFRLRESLDAAGEMSRGDVEAAVDALFLAIEIPDSRFREFEKVGGPQLLADNACAGRFVLGPEVPGWRRLDLAQQPVSISIDGRTVAQGAGSNVLAHPLAALTWVVNDLARRGSPVLAGELVTTGTTTVPAPIRPGVSVRAVFPSLGEVRLRLAE
jgi:2-keto-4-pentenoate hydratase